ncbi:hypothetical protein F4778DRAFT_176121 [Xylariomycetidae sp. FL2044]|nr:hypothetical protein F4778DRAFT_176121 [Xylariomycetidae sp. FL2044]
MAEKGMIQKALFIWQDCVKSNDINNMLNRFYDMIDEKKQIGPRNGLDKWQVPLSNTMAIHKVEITDGNPGEMLGVKLLKQTINQSPETAPIYFVKPDLFDEDKRTLFDPDNFLVPLIKLFRAHDVLYYWWSESSSGAYITIKDAVKSYMIQELTLYCGPGVSPKQIPDLGHLTSLVAVRPGKSSPVPPSNATVSNIATDHSPVIVSRGRNPAPKDHQTPLPETELAAHPSAATLGSGLGKPSAPVSRKFITKGLASSRHNVESSNGESSQSRSRPRHEPQPNGQKDITSPNSLSTNTPRRAFTSINAYAKQSAPGVKTSSIPSKKEWRIRADAAEFIPANAGIRFASSSLNTVLSAPLHVQQPQPTWSFPESSTAFPQPAKAASATKVHTDTETPTNTLKSVPGNCKNPENAIELFEEMVSDGCDFRTCAAYLESELLAHIDPPLGDADTAEWEYQDTIKRFILALKSSFLPLGTGTMNMGVTTPDLHSWFHQVNTRAEDMLKKKEQRERGDLFLGQLLRSSNANEGAGSDDFRSSDWLEW